MATDVVIYPEPDSPLHLAGSSPPAATRAAVGFSPYKASRRPAPFLPPHPVTAVCYLSPPASPPLRLGSSPVSTFAPDAIAAAILPRQRSSLLSARRRAGLRCPPPCSRRPSPGTFSHRPPRRVNLSAALAPSAVVAPAFSFFAVRRRGWHS
ncbi:hypothetical protein E2562_034655 [Oryza meyeriana var. granulata]|uniref:Uncharacterized protein n=1 Tax=Oryza meyeriana var. granulata TaxID=110450 RepID=A0A6G1EDC5_9ORYZ|nr:hypothetical protein E2562_034655 [Oryza meyeriana var. granulata]